MWWSQQQITSTVNEAYIEKELGAKRHIDLLHRVLAFGDGLTDDTYLDWVLERSPRFFLILNDIGVPDKIFEVIDRSFDDDDLPLSQDALWELNLFGTTSETLDKKFYRQQFCFLIQELEPGGHVDYGSWDVVPLEPALKKPSIPAAVQSTDRVFAHGHLYTRKKIPTSGERGIDRIRFIMHLKHIAAIQHQHLVTVWATYSQNNFNFVLLKPSCDITLRHILEDKDIAKQFKCLEKQDRRRTLVTWVHCLLSALAYLHSRGFAHKSIRPSTISVDHNNVIYLNDYQALRVLDVDEAPNPYSGEIYEYAPPENWMRKPTLHETAPLKTLPPGGGRTSRKVPKAAHIEPESRRPSLIGGESTHRPYSRSQNSSSGSSTNAKPRNALITTFAPPDTTPLALPERYFPGDIFSLTAVVLSILSCLLGHSAKTFASQRSRLNRQAGRGNGPPDASFHKNLGQVEKWVGQLAKEAGQKEKKDHKFWGSVVELVSLCTDGLSRDPEERPRADEFEREAMGWIEFGIGKQRKCGCTEEDRSFEESPTPHPVVSAQRDSMLSWSKISERLSSGLGSDDVPPLEHNVRPRRSLSKRLSLDRAPEMQRSRHSRPSSSMDRRFSILAPTEEEPPPSPKSQLARRPPDRTRAAVRNAVPMPASQAHTRSSSKQSKVIHQGRSTYRIKPKKPTPVTTTVRRNTHPCILEEPANAENDGFGDSGLADDENGEEAASAYTLKPRRKTHPAAASNSASTPHRSGSRHQRQIQDFPVPPSPASIAQPPTPTMASSTGLASSAWVPVLHGIPVHSKGEDDDYTLHSTAYDKTEDTNGRIHLQRHESYMSEVWGLGDVRSDAPSIFGDDIEEVDGIYDLTGSKGLNANGGKTSRLGRRDSDVLGMHYANSPVVQDRTPKAESRRERGDTGNGNESRKKVEGKRTSHVYRMDWPLPCSPTFTNTTLQHVG